MAVFLGRKAVPQAGLKDNFAATDDSINDANQRLRRVLDLLDQSLPEFRRFPLR